MPLTASALKESRGMPQPARYIYQQAYESKLAADKSDRVARNYALKELNSTGWEQARFGKRRNRSGMRCGSCTRGSGRDTGSR